MHRILADQTVLFGDHNGLTRLPPKGPAKTAGDVCPECVEALSIGGTPSRVCVLNSATYGLPIVFDVASLKALWKAKQAGGLGLDAESGAILVWTEGAAAGQETRALPLQYEIAARGDVLALGGSKPHRGGINRVIDRGWVLQFETEAKGSTVVLVSLREPTPKPVWRMPVTVAPQSLLMGAVVEQGAWMYSWQPRTGVAHAAFVDAAGKRSTVRELRTLGRLAFDGQSVIYQANEALVLRENPDGTSERFAIPGAENVSPDHRGPGEVLAGEGRVLFVPWHGESVIDLRTGAAHSRKLSAKLADVRAVLAEYLREERRAWSSTLALNNLRVVGSSLGYSRWTAGTDMAPSQAAQAVLEKLPKALQAAKLKSSGANSVGSFLSDE